MLKINDKIEVKEKSSLNNQNNINKGYGYSRIRIYEESRGAYTLKHEGQNKINVSGSAFIASKLVNKSPRILTPTYNDSLNLQNNNPQKANSAGVLREEEVVLFAIGDTGCGPEARQVFDVKYNSWIEPRNLIPFLVKTPVIGDITSELRRQYFGRKIASNGNYEYYFKAFNADPEIYQEYSDGTPITESVYEDTRPLEVTSFIRYSMSVTPTDLRDYWDINNIDDRRVSSISLLTAVPTTLVDENGLSFTYYQNIRPLTVYHFPREEMIGDKGLMITYDQYL